MTKTVVIIAKIKAGSESDFESQITAIFKEVANEPGCVGLTWGPSETPGEYVLVERYADQAAIEAHRASAHMKDLGPALRALFDGAPSRALFTEQ